MLQMRDFGQVEALAAEFATAPLRVIPAIVPVAHTAGGKIKSDMRRNAAGHYRLRGLPASIDYDIDVTATSVTVDVGFNKEGQGNLGNIAAYGTSKTAPFVDIDTPLAKEVPNFMRWVARVGAESL